MIPMVKRLVYSIVLILSFGCNPGEKPAENSAFPFFVGTYTSTEGQGIYKYQINKQGKLKKIGLFAESENPSYLEISNDKKYLVTVNETNSNEGNGTVESFRIH